VEPPPPTGAPTAPPPPAPPTSAQQAEFDKLMAAGLSAANAENYKGAADLFTKALKIKRDAAALRELGKALYGRNQYPAALKVLREAVQLDAKDADAYLHMGLIHQEMNNKAESCKAYRRVRFLEPDSERSHELESVIKNLGC
jgi:tetratricopeptide (TPR) repeat protein